MCNRYFIYLLSHNDIYIFFVVIRDRHISLSPIVLIQKHQPEPLPERQPNKQTQEVAVDVGLKQSLFQKKLRNSLQPKASA